MQQVHEGDIVLAPFRFVETEGAKLRPCLVWSRTPVSLTLVFITSKKIDQAFPQEAIIDEEAARCVGLDKPGRIDFCKRDRCLPHQAVKVLGNISNAPKKTIKQFADAAYAAGLLSD